ncbi:hypothetical protein GWK18_07980 [Kocuria sp. JC486]|uniref:Uncharacterized protein n=1 Tax=Kocuria soli TaxID=2485125 RepID=A0A3N3ZSH2_9MICC|nr:MULTISPECIES: hypothetical protein [Kocuria]NHU85525.1 hypothetical protein [Kocuria sp. JC486]ROZ62656.1 hypothetical protein EDL96_09305 [Kocuria soli]
MHKVFWSHRIVVTSLAVSALLVAGIALSGWYVGSRGAANSGGSPTVSGSTWVGPQGLVHTQNSDVDSLRDEGWTLPLVGLTGYRTEELRQTTVAGQPAVVVNVEYRGNRSIEVVEQRGEVDTEHPVDGFTGLPATAMGMEPTTVAGNVVWVYEGSPWRAMIVHDDVTYTLVSDDAPARMAAVVQQVEAGHRAILERPEELDRGTVDTILVGWRRILGLQ